MHLSSKSSPFTRNDLLSRTENKPLAHAERKNVFPRRPSQVQFAPTMSLASAMIFFQQLESLKRFREQRGDASVLQQCNHESH